MAPVGDALGPFGFTTTSDGIDGLTDLVKRRSSGGTRPMPVTYEVDIA